ncbi:hypothetical protein KCU71_g7226, partial [Aureobasidium melanogenum]
MGKKLRQKAAKFTPPRNKNAFAFRDDSSNNHTGSNTPKPYFSLRDELQSTEKHEWTKESRLRDHKISFVSAGSMAPLDEPKVDKPVLKSEKNVDDRDLRGSEDAMAQMDINAQPSVAIPSLDAVDELDMDVDETVHIHAHAEITIPVEQPAPQQQPVPSPPPQVEDAPMFFVDTAGDESLAFKGPKSVPAPRAPSPARSSSSDEVVFRGRSGVTIRNDPPAVAQKPASKPASKPSSKPVAQPTPQVNPQLEKFLKSLDNPPEWAKEMSEKSKSRESPTQPAEHWPSMEEANGFADRLDQDLSGVRASRKSKKNRKKQNRIFRLEQDLEDELLRDYIDNIAAEDMPTRARGLGGDSGDDTDEFFDGLLNEEEKDPDDVDVTGLEDEWEDESGSEEEEDDDDDEDDDTGSEDSSELEERLAREEREAWEDDADIRERRAQAMTDEELALLFMKQEELGIDGDDIMLYDDRFGDVDGAREGLANYSFKQPKSGKKKKGGRKSDNFPDATLMADVLEQDAYGGFDVMDFDRPSLRKKNKGRKSGPLPEELGLSDSDLVEELQNQWANDRSKKASKKAEREELRQLGLLGKKNKFKPDMNQRYTEGITIAQVRFELQDFLEQEDHTTKAFPPMQKNDRKVLHEIANHFNLKSKSVGSGKNRAPVLIKTSRTVEWSEQHFHRVSSFVSRGYLKNSSKKPKSTMAGEIRRTRQMGGGGGGAAAYRNGDVVGHNASEIPASNFGRKLMEKMGWAAGMSLGKEGSGGLLVPVQATVKSGKAGLG